MQIYAMEKTQFAEQSQQFGENHSKIIERLRLLKDDKNPVLTSTFNNADLQTKQLMMDLGLGTFHEYDGNYREPGIKPEINLAGTLFLTNPNGIATLLNSIEAHHHVSVDQILLID